MSVLIPKTPCIWAVSGKAIIALIKIEQFMMVLWRIVKKSCVCTVSASHCVDWRNINVSCAANMRIFNFKLKQTYFNSVFTVLHEF